MVTILADYGNLCQFQIHYSRSTSALLFFTHPLLGNQQHIFNRVVKSLDLKNPFVKVVLLKATTTFLPVNDLFLSYILRKATKTRVWRCGLSVTARHISGLNIFNG